MSTSRSDPDPEPVVEPSTGPDAGVTGTATATGTDADATGPGTSATDASADATGTSTGTGTDADATATDAGATDASADATGAGTTLVSVGKEVVARVKSDYVPLTAAGVAFFAFLAVIPTLVALVAVYGLVADPAAIEDRVNDMTSTLPDEVRNMLVQQLKAISSSADEALTAGLVIGLGVALWSASSGMGHLIGAVNIAYGSRQPRPFLAKRLLGLSFTLGGVVFAAVAIGVITALPAVLSVLGVTGRARWLLALAVWPIVGSGLVLALAVLYRFAPNRRRQPRWRLVSLGAVLATVAWLLASIGFQVYVANFGSYNETYGSLGAIVVLMLWIWISAMVILVGAVVNHVLEGPEAPVAEAAAGDRSAGRR